MARNSVKAMTLPNVETTLAKRPPTYSVVSKSAKLTSPAALAAIPPLNVCMDVRKVLYGMKIDKSKEQLAVVSWPGYGTFSWQGIQDIVRIHYARKTKLEIKEEEKWFPKLCSDLSGKQYETLLEDIQNFQSTLWTSGSEDRVYNAALKVETLCKIVCDRWINDDIIDCIFKMLNSNSKEHLFVVATESLLYSTKTQQNLRAEIHKKVPDGLRYVHFALNVSKSSTGTVSVGNGNHWTYFVFNSSLSELYYGDSLGWNLPNNLSTVMKPFFEVLCFVHGKSYTKPRRPTLMHHVNDHGSLHHCNEKCFQGFPLQTCRSACFTAALAREDENSWKCILDWNKPDKVTMNSVKKIKHISANSSFLRAVIISWLVQDEVSLCYLDEKNPPAEKKNTKAKDSLDETNNPLNRGSSSNKFPTEKIPKKFTCTEEMKSGNCLLDDNNQPAKTLPSDSEILTKAPSTEKKIPAKNLPTAESLYTDTEIPAKNLSNDDELPAEKLQTESILPAKELKTDTELPTKDLETDTELSGKNQPTDNETPAKNVRTDAKLPANNLPTDTEIPTDSLPVHSKNPAKSQPANSKVPENNLPVENDTADSPTQDFSVSDSQLPFPGASKEFYRH